MKFVPLDLSTAKPVIFIDSSFSNARGPLIQLGYIILLVYAAGNCKIMHYGSNRCQPVVQSVLAAELHALVLGSDYFVTIQHPISQLFRLKIALEAFSESKTLFDVVAKDGTTSELHLMIDVSARTPQK